MFSYIINYLYRYCVPTIYIFMTLFFLLIFFIYTACVVHYYALYMYAIYFVEKIVYHLLLHFFLG